MFCSTPDFGGDITDSRMETHSGRISIFNFLYLPYGQPDRQAMMRNIEQMEWDDVSEQGQGAGH